MSSIGQAIRNERRLRGWSQALLAAKAGVDPRTVGRVERGEVETPSTADKLQRALGIGIYRPEQPEPEPAPEQRGADLLLQDANFHELLGALATRYGRDLRAGHSIPVIDELPPHVAAADDSDAPTGRDTPNEDDKSG